LPKLEAIATDAAIDLVIASPSVLEACANHLEAYAALGRASWMLVEDLRDAPAAAACRAISEPQSIAFLQYTSGSTGHPKGVMITNDNIIANAATIESAMQLAPETRFLSWLPLYHDMGLSSGVLQPIFTGYHVVLMSPAAFLRRPLGWLETIDRYAINVSGAPNFAYELCCDRAEASPPAVDLSQWRVAFNGAEPIRPTTAGRFGATFAANGFRPGAMMACYGLAEATLMVSCTPPGAGLHNLQREELGDLGDRANEALVSQAKTLVSCGFPAPGLQVEIYDPATHKIVPPLCIGEVVIAGSNVTPGYWKRPDLNESLFTQSLGEANRPFLRTGDLGFLKDGQLYVAGRIKDLIKIRGRGLAPEDIEDCVIKADAALQPGAAAAVPIDVRGQEGLAIAVEVKRTAMRGLTPAAREAIFAAICATVADEHQVQPARIALLSPGSLPKTTSGKVMRSAIRRMLESDDAGPAIDCWSSAALQATPPEPRDETIDALLDWIRRYVARTDFFLIDERRTLPPNVVLDLAEVGLFGLDAPATRGGLALKHHQVARVISQIAAADLNLALFVGLHTALGVAPLAHHGADRHDPVLRELAAGRALAAFALTEEGAGSNPHAIVARAERTSHGGWRLNGQKIWSGSAAWAKYITVFAQGVDADGASIGTVALLVNTREPGVTMGPEALTMGMRGMVQNTVTFRDVNLPGDALIGQPGDGLRIAMDTMMRARLGIAAMSLGAMKAAVRLGGRYASQRQVGVGLLGAIPHTRARLSAHLAAIDMLETLIAGACDRLDRGHVDEPWLLVLKIWSAEQLWRCVDDVVQLAGGRGYIETNPLARLLRDSRILRIFEGPSEALQHHLGATALRDPAAFTRFLDRVEGGADTAPRFTQALANLRDGQKNQAASAEDTQSARLSLSFETGRVCVAAAVLAAAQRRGAPEAKRLAEDQWRVALIESERAVSRPPPAFADLANRLADIDRDIGTAELEAGVNQAGPDLEVRSSAARETGVARRLPSDSAVAQREIGVWIQGWFRRKLGSDVRLAPDQPLSTLGIDSVTAVEFIEAASEQFQLDLPAELAWEFPTLDELVQELVVRQAASHRPEGRPSIDKARSKAESDLFSYLASSPPAEELQ
jgi:alkylation response protein AidB-like acyl-CoA dehydrogenase/acyl carrier protein